MGFMVSRGVQSAMCNLLRSRLRAIRYAAVCCAQSCEWISWRSAVPVCFCRCSSVTTGWLRMHGAAHREPPPAQKVCRAIL